MERIIQAPSRYIQGENGLLKLAVYMKQLGGSYAYLLADGFSAKSFANLLPRSFLEEGLRYQLEELKGECCLSEIDRHCQLLRKEGCDCVIGVGGGKALDTAKAISYYTRLPLIVAPTAASMDGPCSGLAVLYTEDGVFDHYLHLRTNPAVVVADTSVISKAPPRLLAAGMGDALSTYYEANACQLSQATTNTGAHSTNAARTLARLCLDTILRDGAAAYAAAECGVQTPALENIIEANLYLSCIGFESGGLAAAHALHNGLTLLPQTRKSMHGEIVAFCTIAQLVLENRSPDEIRQLQRFCRSVKLPITLAEIGLGDCPEESLRQAAAASLGSNSYMNHMPFQVSADDAYAALKVADRLGNQYS